VTEVKHSALISYSKHYYFKKNGGIGWQKTELTKHSKKQRLVWYILSKQGKRRSNIYCEISPNFCCKHATGFFDNAFETKNGRALFEEKNSYLLDHQIEGIPENLVITKKMLKDFPDIHSHLDKLSIKAYTSSNSFKTPGSVVTKYRNLENYLDQFLYFHRKTNLVNNLVYDDEDLLRLFSIIFSESFNLYHKTESEKSNDDYLNLYKCFGAE